MSLPRFLILSCVLAAVACVCPSTVEAGGLLHRLFGHRHCRPVKACRPCCVPPSQSECGCGSIGQGAPPDCVPCMRGNGYGGGDPDKCADQRERDEECCERHADDTDAYNACMKLAMLRELACKRRMPFRVTCPRGEGFLPACDCDYCETYECQYECNYQCWLDEYCPTCDPDVHDCSVCERVGKDAGK